MADRSARHQEGTDIVMKESFARTGMLLGEEGINRLQSARVAVAGLGGVGGHCAEALARAGVGALLLIDADVVEQSNLNRQLIATKHTLGMRKTEAMRTRIEEISDCDVECSNIFILPDTVEEAFTGKLSFILDAVDTVTAKLAIAGWAQAHGVPLISCMGTGNRLDPSLLQVVDIYETEGCPLARAVRRGCKKQGIRRLPVVVSREPALPVLHARDAVEAQKRVPGSAPFVPAAAGLLMASRVVQSIARAEVLVNP